MKTLKHRMYLRNTGVSGDNKVQNGYFYNLPRAIWKGFINGVYMQIRSLFFVWFNSYGKV